jgi:hypothetical protein
MIPQEFASGLPRDEGVSRQVMTALKAAEQQAKAALIPRSAPQAEVLRLT